MRKEKFSQWTKTQRNGIWGLIVLIVVVQVVYFLTDFSQEVDFSYAQLADFQEEVDSIRNQNSPKGKQEFTFNPNFLTDYRAYQLGISPTEMARLQAFRSEGKFVNSAEDFQKVTQISDSLLQKIAPLFKFPQWVNQSKSNAKKEIVTNSKSVSKVIEKEDINTATINDLKKINGIGDKLSERIIKYRNRLQGFSFKEQLTEVYGLETEVIQRIWQQFDIKTTPAIVKIDINSASKFELSKIPYLSSSDVEEILLLRTNVGYIKNLTELLQIKSFDEAKIKKIALYLSVQE